ncbi:restriction endonuclease [Bacillus spongiae]|uniref:Restriction endonuclease n=1 Tax=Bacillus spongiae TaxID=2683610 RepID=A0ABU8HFI0_9BACI
MLIIEVFIALILTAAFVHFTLTKRKNDYKTSLLSDHIVKSEDLKRTLAMGLYYRFKKETSEMPTTYSSIYNKQDPLMFESFVADVIENAKGGSTWVSPASGDSGVDFEHTMKDGLYLGQIKCYKEDLSFAPIAILHSNMVKKGAVGGYVITTSAFTKAAREYAEGLNIELIDGIKLVELWFDGVDDVEREIKNFSPEYV